MIFVRAGFQYYTGQVIENTYLLQMSIIILTWDQAFKDMQQVIEKLDLILVKKSTQKKLVLVFAYFLQPSKVPRAPQASNDSDRHLKHRTYNK